MSLPNQPSESFKRRNPSLYGNQTRCSLFSPEPKRDQEKALVGADAREKKSFHSTVVGFVGYRVRPLDPDNFAGGCKDLLDGLRHSGLIKGDEWWRIKLETSQEKVNHKSDELTEITIRYNETT